ncbi:MAG: hypothetical protein ACTSRG_15725 [Candidatus Helarchaeota archaeon]
MEKKKLSPYLILLPDDPEAQKEILETIFGSKIAQSIIVDIDAGIIFQKDLIIKLKYSNKSIINYLKKLVELDILAEDSTLVEGHRRLSYKLTPMGQWFSSLVVYREYKPQEFKEKLEQLFQIYLKHAIGLLLENEFEQEKIRDIFEFTLSSHLKEDYISKLTFKKYVEDINSLKNELKSILDSINSLDKDKREDLLKIKEIKELFVDFDDFYGILKHKFEKLNEKLKKI